MEKKKALDERDLNILGQLSQLNWSIVVVNEHGRDVEEKERELARKKYDLDRREKEVERKEGTHAHNLHEVNKKNIMRTRDLFDDSRFMDLWIQRILMSLRQAISSKLLRDQQLVKSDPKQTI